MRRGRRESYLTMHLPRLLHLHPGFPIACVQYETQSYRANTANVMTSDYNNKRRGIRTFIILKSDLISSVRPVIEQSSGTKQINSFASI